MRWGLCRKEVGGAAWCGVGVKAAEMQLLPLLEEVLHYLRSIDTPIIARNNSLYYFKSFTSILHDRLHQMAAQ